MQDVQLYTKSTTGNEITDILTGEVLKADDIVSLSEAKKRTNLKRRELERQEEWIDEKLLPIVLEAFEKGADTFCEFWKIQKGALRFDKKLFYEKATPEEIMAYEEADNKIKELTDKAEYRKASDPSLRYPKF